MARHISPTVLNVENRYDDNQGIGQIALLQRNGLTSAMTSPTSHIRLENIYKVFGPDPAHGLKLFSDGVSREELNQLGHVVALNNVNISIPSGQIFVVMGLSGSGKSTLVRCINRLVDPTAGRVLIEDQDITRLTPAELRQVRMRKLAMVFQRFALFPHMTVLDNIAFGLRVMGIDKKSRRQKALEAVRLVGLEGWEHRRPRQLSGGMQQRVGLARAIAMDTPILLMDEPFSSLDPLLREEMQRELLRLQQQLHKTIVFITHDLAEAITVGNRIAILRSGQVIQEDDPIRIVLHPTDSYVEAFVRDVNVLKILTAQQAADDSLATMQDGPALASAANLRKAGGTIIVVDSNARPMGTLDPHGFREGQLTSVGTSLNRVFAVLLSDAPIMPHLPMIASGDQPVLVVDHDGRYKGTITGQSVVRAIVTARKSADGMRDESGSKELNRAIANG